MGKIVVPVSFRQQIISISKRKMLDVELEIVEKIEVFIVFDAIAVQFSRVFVISSLTLNNERTSDALHFSTRTLQRFASKTPTFFRFQHHHF